jgi:2-iminobutanoate/2-iminopropanoate deaminase
MIVGRRTSIYIESLGHGVNPIPAACLKDGLLVSGAVYGADPSATADTGLDEQCAVLFARIRAIVTAAGGTVEDIVKIAIRMADPSKRDVLNKHWLAQFPDPESRPARHVEPLAPGRRLIAAEFIAMLDK